ncbi:efflux RND transporter periplasmic adaptor subunit [bacterium]|nr:efflux RND transporter periplasmic adaptor subunit [candidate division CSSED10-310 bacterium]
MTRKDRKRRRWPWVVVILLVLLVVGGGLVQRTLHKDKKAQQFPTYRTAMVEIADIQVTIEEVGTIEPAKKVEIKSNLSGRVTEILVREGDTVTRDQLLAVVEPELSSARSISQIRTALVRANIELEDARTNVESARQLFKEGFMSEDQLDQAEVLYNTAMESYRSAKNEFDIVNKQGIPIDLKKTGIQSVNLVSPQDGVVIRANIEIGEMVTSGTSSFNAGTVLFEVADLSEMIIEAAVNEIEIGKIHSGQQVKIKIDAYPRVPFLGHVSHIAPAARTETGENVKVFDIEVAIDEAGGELRSGMTANIDILGDRREGVMTVPIEAVFEVDDQDVVYVKRIEPLPEPTPAVAVTPAGEKKPPNLEGVAGIMPDKNAWKRYYEERPVKVGLIGTDKVEIVDGLAEGEEVALENPTVPIATKEQFFR